MNELSIRRIGTALSALGLATYILCVLWDLVVPAAAMRSAWSPFLPGFQWSPGGVLLGIAEVVVYAYFAALVFVPAYNLLGSTSRAVPRRWGTGPSTQ